MQTTVKQTTVKQTVVKLQKSPKLDKKFMVTVDNGGALRTIHFGGRGFSDFTMHKDKARKKRYIGRHRAREDWSAAGILTAGFWAKHLLWNESTLQKSKDDISMRFGVVFA